MPRAKTRVNVYRRGQSYGGPEEGGWYYETGTPVLSLVVELPTMDQSLDEPDAEFQRFKDETIKSWAEDVAETLRKTYTDERQRYSAAPRSDDFEVIVERKTPVAWPEHRPHYE